MRIQIISLLTTLLLVSLPLSAQENEPDAALRALAAEFFEWRRSRQPAGGPGVSRVERPDAWVPDFSPQVLIDSKVRYQEFRHSLEQLEQENWNRADQIDARLLKSAIERVHWELEILQSPSRDPLFYLNQTLGSVFELLILSSPMSTERAENIILRLEHIPQTLKSARVNLDQPIRPFAAAAIAKLEGIGLRLETMASALSPEFPTALEARLEKAVRKATAALEKYSRWLSSGLENMRTTFAIGPLSYQWFLSHVALIPFTPNELLAQSQQEWNRAVALDVIEKNRNRDVPKTALLGSSEQQVKASFLKENEIRAFLQSRHLATVPDWLMHYRQRPLPDYLAPLSLLGETNDLTSQTRLDEDAIAYIPDPSGDLPYFALSSARHPRPQIIREGIPGHYFQLALSWANPNPIRRNYFDSSANNGISFYVSELMLASGLFDFSPRSREIIHSFMRLRALSAETDIRLAVGDLTIDQAAEYLARAVPMDQATAKKQALLFASNPGRGISHQIGKLQILKFLTDARMERGEDFSLQNFHDLLMRNGNTPIALQRWEYLGQDRQILRLDVLGGKPVTVPR